MASNTERLDYGATGLHVYALAFLRASNAVWNAASAGLEAYADANYANYAVALAEIGSSGIYLFTAPPSLPVGDYDLFMRLRAGGAAATTDSPASAISEHWDGAALSPVAALVAPGTYPVPPTVLEIDQQLSLAHGAGSWLTGSAGGEPVIVYGTSGTLTVTVTELDAFNNPIAGVEVWISQDAAGIQRTQAETTDDVGQSHFRLDPQDAYLWREKPGFTWEPNPKPITISASTTTFRDSS